MDQNVNGTPGEAGDFYATPTPLGTGAAFTAPYAPNTLPLIIPGPHLVGTRAVLTGGTLAPITSDNLVTDKTVSGLDVTFDRDMNAASFTAAKVLQIIGPAGPITGLINVAVSPANANPSHIRTFRITFPTQQLSGTYTLTLDSGIQSVAGDKLDSNLNAGVDVLRGISPTGATTPIATPSNDTPITILPLKTITSNITISDNFPIQGATLTLNITYPNDPDLEASLIALDPGGNPANNIVIPLFTRVGAAGGQQGFNGTTFDDSAATPIQSGGRPFFGSFKPQQSLVTALLNIGSARTFQLQIKNNSSTNTGTLTSWSLTLLKGVPGTGLGELVADRAQTSFRIFTMDPTNPLSSNTWTAIGPASTNNTNLAGPVSAVVIDPSDPSGNTAYVSATSGGIWKTINFLTTSAQGPTYRPLTDFGPTFGINAASIAVFGRNNDTNQSVVIAGTGDPSGNFNNQFRGVGFLRSNDGGTSWSLLDSSTNVDSSGNLLPITSPQRDHIFAGSTIYKVVVDPKPTNSGGVIVYAAVSDPGGPGGGIWRSVDGGSHWTRTLAGDATDIVLDPASGVINAFSNPTGNLQILYAAISGVGVYQSQNEGLGWNQLLGGVGNAFFQDSSKFPTTPVPITGSTAAPTGGGRIVLAKPALTGSASQNALYQGWLYAAVVSPAAPGSIQGQLQGLFMTKDFGRNWTPIHLPNQANGATGGIQANPSNDTSLGDVDPLDNAGGTAISLTVDPNNPNVVYLGGTHILNPTGLIRVDTTGISDPYSFYLGENTATNAVRADTTDPVGLSKPTAGPTATTQYLPALGIFTQFDVRNQPTINMVHDPFNPFSNATFFTDNVTSFANSGADARWMPVDSLPTGTYQHQIVAIRDSLTGDTRLVFATNQGVFTSLRRQQGQPGDRLWPHRRPGQRGHFVRHRQPKRQPPDRPVLLWGCAAEQRGRPDRGAAGHVLWRLLPERPPAVQSQRDPARPSRLR